MDHSGPALVHVAGTVRVAAFTWQTATGLAWLEPDYLEPEPPPRSAFHHVAGEVRDDPAGVLVLGEEEPVLVFPSIRAQDDPLLCPPYARAGLERLAELLATTTWEDERVRVTQLLAEDLDRLGGIV